MSDEPGEVWICRYYPKRRFRIDVVGSVTRYYLLPRVVQLAYVVLEDGASWWHPE